MFAVNQYYNRRQRAEIDMQSTRQKLTIHSTIPDYREPSPKQKVALITGITGQDGSYLTELLLSKNYLVIGIVRSSSAPNTWRLAHLSRHQDINEHLKLYFGDVLDTSFIRDLIRSTQPDELYHLAAQSSVAISFQNPQYTVDVNALGTQTILEALKDFSKTKKVKFYNASTSELFGDSIIERHNEQSPLYPKSPYGLAKLFGYWATRHYREAYGLFAVNGILFNHESPRRGELFVTQKIAMSVARISLGYEEHLELGNIDSIRDWGHAKDYVMGIWLIMQHPTPDDFVICSEESHSVREFVELAFARVGIDIRWDGSHELTRGVDRTTNKTLVRIDPSLYRDLEIDALKGDASKARKLLPWLYKRSFQELIEEMVDNALAVVSKDSLSKL